MPFLERFELPQIRMTAHQQLTVALAVGERGRLNAAELF